MTNIFEMQILQNETSVSFKITTDKNLTISRLAGTISNEVSEFMKAVKSTRAKVGIKFNKPFQVRFKTESELIFESAKIETYFQDTIRLTNSEQAKKRFANSMFSMLNYVNSQTRGKLVDVMEFVNKCDEKIAVKLEAAQAN